MWSMTIQRVNNGYKIYAPSQDKTEDPEEWVVEDVEGDDLKSHINMLYDVLEHFGVYGSKHDAERIRIVREVNENGSLKWGKDIYEYQENTSTG